MSALMQGHRGAPSSWRLDQMPGLPGGHFPNVTCHFSGRKDDVLLRLQLRWKGGEPAGQAATVSEGGSPWLSGDPACLQPVDCEVTTTV